MSQGSRSMHEPTSLVEHSSLPLLTLKGKSNEPQMQAYVNAYVLGEKKMLVHGQLATPLYYLSLVAMKGQGTTLQAIFARLVNPHGKGIWLEGVGEVALAHHQPQLLQCGYSLHWNFEQAEVQPTQDLHAVIESRMLTVYDPVHAQARKTRERRTPTSSPQGEPRARRKERVSLSTDKPSQTQESLSEMRHREQHPLFVLLVPSSDQGDRQALWQQHLAFLDLRVPWPLDPSWARFLWERGVERGEIEPLATWSYTPAAPDPEEDERPQD